jgi:general secretion pathway protein I
LKTGTAPPRGFTLIEVLVALVIVAFGMGAVLAALSSAAESVMRLREQSFAEWVGFNQLATTRLKATLPPVGTTSGDVEFAATHWQWQQTVTKMDIPGLLRIIIRVRSAAAAQQAAPGAKSPANDTWLATVMGFRGDALQTPLDVIPPWDGSGQNQGPGDGGGPNQGPGAGGVPGNTAPPPKQPPVPPK